MQSLYRFQIGAGLNRMEAGKLDGILWRHRREPKNIAWAQLNEGVKIAGNHCRNFWIAAGRLVVSQEYGRDAFTRNLNAAFQDRFRWNGKRTLKGQWRAIKANAHPVIGCAETVLRPKQNLFGIILKVLALWTQNYADVIWR